MRIRLLGTVEAVAESGPAPLGGVRLRGLLARLALDAGRPVGTSTLVDDLWGEHPPDGAANALQSLVSRLRRAIGTDLVGNDGGSYRLRTAPADVDVGAFAALVAAATTTPPAGALAHLREALALWRGPALADVEELPFAPPAAARLTERRATALEEAARLSLQLGDPGPELDALAAQLDAMPLRESTATLLARGLQAAGRQADALAVLDRTRDRLADELGVDPGAEWAAARQAVLRHEGVVAARPVRERPAALTSFVGRERDVERLAALVASARLVTLTGPGGAGKTRLSREVGGDGRDRAVAELAALTSPEQLPATLLAAVGGAELVLRGQEEAGPDTTTRLVMALAGRDLLLVLDNCEHLVDAVATLTERLLTDAPRLRVLATSREPLGVPGEVLHPVAALPDDDAVRLFADRAAAVSPGFTVTPAVAGAVREICRRLDGQPLPIELAAARTRTLTPAEIAARLDDRFRLLTSGARTALPRHQTLRAVVDWSWDLLDEPERAVARRLGVFAGGATAAAAERVCGGPAGAAPEDVFELLASLVDKSLVVVVAQPDGAPTRYRMLETIRAYAGERLDEAGERETTVAAHTAFMLEIAEAAEPKLRGAAQLGALAELRHEAEEIDVALRRAIAGGDAVIAHRLVAAVGWWWIIRGLHDEATGAVDEVFGLSGPVPAATLARTLTLRALAAVGMNDVPAGERYVQEVLALANGLPRPLHPLVQLVGPVYRIFGAHERAPIEELSRTSETLWVRGFATMLRAQIAENDGLIDEQRTLIREAHEIFRVVGDRFGLGMVLHSLGEIEETAGSLDLAAAAYDEAIQLAQELDNIDDMPQFFLRRAVVEANRGDLDAGRRRLGDIIDTYSRGGLFGGGPSTAYLALVEIELTAGDIDAARRAYALAGDGWDERIAAPQRKAIQLRALASIEIAADDRQSARATLVDALEAARPAGDGPVAAGLAEMVAQFAAGIGEFDGAGRMLGIAVRQRGAINRGDPRVVRTADEVRAALGADGYDAALCRGREVARTAGIDAMSSFLSGLDLDSNVDAARAHR